MYLFSILAFYPVYLAVGLVMDWPYMKLPNHHHFGVWSWWAYFRRPVKRIPKNVITGNQGWFRIYLHYFYLFFFSVLGRKNHKKKLRIFNTAYNSLTAVSIHWVAVKAGMPTGQAVACAVLFLYLISRPIMTSYFVNAEPFAILFTTLSLGMLIESATSIPVDMHAAVLWFWAFSFFFGLTTLLNKLSHAVEYGFIFIAYCLITKTFGLWLLAGLYGCGLSLGVFLILFKKDLYKEGFTCFINYMRIQSNDDMTAWLSHLRRYLLPVVLSIGHLLLAAILGTDFFGVQGKPYHLISIFFAASMVSLIVQRTFLFHHWIVVMPFCALCAGHFLFSIPTLPGIWAWGAALLVIFPQLGRFSIDLKAYALSNPYALGKYIFGNDFKFFFNPLCPNAVSLCEEQPFSDGKIMFWSIHVELYVETNRMPICFEQPFCGAAVYLFNPSYDSLLKSAFLKDPPQYIFDLNALGEYESYGAFSPLLFYLSTGLKYRPKQLTNGILIYEYVEKTKSFELPFPHKLMATTMSQEQRLIIANFKELFHVRSGHEAQSPGNRIQLPCNDLYECIEEVLVVMLPEHIHTQLEFNPTNPLESRSIRLQFLSMLSLDAVATVSSPNALPLYMSMLAHSVGKDQLAKQYELLIEPMFIEQIVPMSLSFSLAMNLLRIRRGDSLKTLFPEDKNLYFSERPRNLISLIRLISLVVMSFQHRQEYLKSVFWILNEIHIEKDVPSPIDFKNARLFEELKLKIEKFQLQTDVVRD